MHRRTPEPVILASARDAREDLERGYLWFGFEGFAKAAGCHERGHLLISIPCTLNLLPVPAVQLASSLEHSGFNECTALKSTGRCCAE